MIKRKWRLLQTGFGDAAYNMALDETLCNAYSQRLIPPTLRIYGWEPPALSLGYSQDAAQELNLKAIDAAGFSYVRRITGGGIIFHDKELTYSLVCSSENIQTEGVKESYKHLCLFLLNTYRALGLKPAFANDVVASSVNRRHSSFCFATNEAYDIIIEGKKIGGNAQKRRRGTIFQHGSIPFALDMKRASSFLKRPLDDISSSVCALDDALGYAIGFKELADVIVAAFKNTLLVDLERQELTLNEKIAALKLKEEKYSQPAWNFSHKKYIGYLATKRDVNPAREKCMILK